MQDLIIHIGLHNTGTTWLQQYFFPEIKDSNIISNEDLSGLPMDGHNVEYRDMIMYGLKQVYPNARIIIGIRDKPGWVLSLYNNYVKRGGIYTFDYWVNNVFDKHHLDYEEYISYLQQLFNNQVFVYDFNEFIKDKETILNSMCSFIGCSLPSYKDVIINKRWNKHLLFFGLHFNKLVGRIREVLSILNNPDRRKPL